MDKEAQPIMIGNLLANALGLIASYLEPCPFTILISLGGTEWAIGKTNEPFRLVSGWKHGPFIHIYFEVCGYMRHNYDKLVGQQTLYPLGLVWIMD